MNCGFDFEQLDRYKQYVESLEQLLAKGKATIPLHELGSIGLSLSAIDEILGQDIAATELFLGTTTVDQTVNIA